MEFEGGVTAAFTMVAFTEEICQRKTSIYGSKVARNQCVYVFLINVNERVFTLFSVAIG